MAKEYIEREALLAEYDRQHTGEPGRARKLIEDAPAADVVEAVNGHWVGLEYDGYADGFPVYDLWECSECGEEVRGEDVPQTHPWCHGCGARMDGGDDA